MRSIQDSGNPAAKPGDSAEAAHREAIEAQIARIAAAMAACEMLGDTDLARRTGRTLLAVVACATDALLADGGQALQTAPDKFGAFFDKAAAGYVQAIDGLAKGAALAEAAGNGFAAARPRAEDPLARSIAAWGRPS
jgi:hypothetical protein